MMRRSLIVVPAGVLALIVALVFVAWFSLRHNVTPEAMSQIKPGMTRAEVEAILGGPPGKYYRWRRHSVVRLTASPHPDDWIADDFALCVQYDAAGRVDRVADVSTLMMPRGQGLYVGGRNVMPAFMSHWLGWEDKHSHP